MTFISVTARVYQYFAGLSLADKFLLFAGKISSPITWNERDRTVTVTILSQLEDREVGFSAEEGQFEYLPAEMVSKPWPLIFGTVINNPCLEVTTAITGTTLDAGGHPCWRRTHVEPAVREQCGLSDQHDRRGLPQAASAESGRCLEGGQRRYRLASARTGRRLVCGYVAAANAANAENVETGGPPTRNNLTISPSS